MVSTFSSGQALDNWLDSNVDLLDLITDRQEPILPPFLGNDESKMTALEILQSLADETEQELANSNPSSPFASEKKDLNNGIVEMPDESTSFLMGMLLNDNPPTQFTEDVLQPKSVMDIDVDEHLILEASASAILSPVSADDVESLLSSSPCSPYGNDFSVGTASPEMLSDEDTADNTWCPDSHRKKRVRGVPYHKASKNSSVNNKISDRKQRKKQQNRDAALKYRQKKKNESNDVDKQCLELEKHNDGLKDKVDQMTREIQYLKDLMKEVYKARGLDVKFPSFD